jgi:hypothetical protein
MNIINRIYILYLTSSAAVVTAVIIGALVRYLLPQTFSPRELVATAASLASAFLVFTQDLSLSSLSHASQLSSPAFTLTFLICALISINGLMVLFILRLTASPGQTRGPITCW